jgi:hypothetical protein
VFSASLVLLVSLISLSLCPHLLVLAQALICLSVNMWHTSTAQFRVLAQHCLIRCVILLPHYAMITVSAALCQLQAVLRTNSHCTVYNLRRHQDLGISCNPAIFIVWLLLRLFDIIVSSEEVVQCYEMGKLLCIFNWDR